MPALRDVLPLKKSQDPTVPRRLLYLDQNVVSTIAKFRLGRTMPEPLRDAIARLYAAIQVAVGSREDAICIESMFHREESSGLITSAKYSSP